MLKDTKTFSGFAVNDLGKAKEFYGNVLGLDVKETPQGLEVHVGDGRDIFVYQELTHEPGSYTMLYFIVDDIDKAVDELVARGVKFEVYNEEYIKTDGKGIARSSDPSEGPTIAWFKDPSGNFLAVMNK